ncbi:MAG: Gmad2 immunoglobulin-like domain-containing protein [Bacteroidota bacterium]|nr:Gmad2 immunoglobulin-like domain-containing protein [Bacteroidota bacterium]
MKHIFILLVITISGCIPREKQKEPVVKTETVKVPDSVTVEKEIPTAPKPSAKVYANARFKDVTVEKIDDHKFLIKGKGQIFEASFSWVVEDGHEELKNGYQMTDAGAPEWGNFSFTIDVAKKRANSTLNLILFESSPMDGSRQHELPILLY